MIINFYLFIKFFIYLFAFTYTFTYTFTFTFRKEAEVEMEGSFLVRLIYDDEITYNLIEAAEKVLSNKIL